MRDGTAFVLGMWIVILTSLTCARDLPNADPWYMPRNAEERALLEEYGEGDLGMEKLAEMREEAWRNHEGCPYWREHPSDPCDCPYDQDCAEVGGVIRPGSGE